MGLGKMHAFLMGVFGGAVSGQGATTGQALVKQANGSWAPGTVSGGSASQFVATSDGSASAPAFRGTESNTGIYFLGDSIKFSINGFEYLRVNSTDGWCGAGASALWGYLDRVVPVTADTALEALFSGVIYTNTGASGAVNLTLPTPGLAGVRYSLVIAANQYVRFTAGTGWTIRDGATLSATAGYIRSTTVGSTLTLVNIDTSSQWVVLNKTGTWTVDS